MTNKKVIQSLPKVLDSLSTGVMEYWSVEKNINPLVITPTLQYSITPRLTEIESTHDGSPSFGLSIRYLLIGFTPAHPLFGGYKLQFPAFQPDF